MNIEAKLPLHKVVPLFTLPDKHGTTQNLAKQRGRDHLLIALFADNTDPQAYLRTLAAHTDEWKQLPARGIVVVGSEDAAGALGSLPFTILIDANNAVRTRFLPDEAEAGVFVTDRYGSLYQQWLVASVTELPSADDLGGWLQAIGMQCSI